MSETTVLYTGPIAGLPVRFFRSHQADPDFPWIAIEDLHAALRLPRSLRREFTAKLRDSEWKDDVRTVQVSGKPVLIGPHFMAQGLIGAMVDCGVAPAGADLDYAMQGMAAVDAECALLGLTKSQAGDRIIQAAMGKAGVTVPKKIDPETGEMFVNLGDLQDAMGMSDEEVDNSITLMKARGQGASIKKIHPSKLVTLQ